MSQSHLDPIRESERWAAALGKAFDALIAANPSDDIYALAIFTSLEAGFPSLTAVSDRSLRQMQEELGHSDVEFEWFDSPHFGFGDALIAELRPAWEADFASSVPESDSDTYSAGIDRRMNVLVGALRLLRERGRLRLRPDGGESFANVVIDDVSDTERAVVLNPPGPLLDLYLSGWTPLRVDETSHRR